MLKWIDGKTFIGAFTTFSIILLILLSENPAAPPSLFKIENGDVRVEAYDKSGNIIASVFLNDTELFVISGKDSGIVLNNKKASMSSMFNGLKKVKVSDKKKYKELKVYYSGNKSQAGYIFRLWNNSKLEVIPFAEIENNSIGTAETIFLYKVKLEKIQNSILHEKGRFVWRAEDYYIPEINTYQDIYYGSGFFRLTYEGAVRVENRIEGRVTSVSLPRTHGAYPPIVFDFSPELRSPHGMVITAAKDVTNGNIYIYYNGTLLFKLNPSLSVLQYNKKYRSIVGARNSFFNFNDEKLGAIRQLNDGYELEIRWTNKSKDPGEIGYRIAVRNNNSVNISMFVVSKYPERIGRAAYGIQYSGVDKIVTPLSRIIDTTSRSNAIEKFDEYRIPIQVSTDTERLIYGNSGYSLELTSEMERIDNLVKNKAVKVFISNHTLGKHINFAGISFRVSSDTSYPESNSSLSPYSIITTENVNDRNVRIYYNNTQILKFNGWEAIFSFNNSVKRLSVPSKRKDIGLFTEYDSKRVRISENNDSYTLRVSWYNKTKDPYEAGWLFTLPKNNSYIKIELFFNSTYKLVGLAPGFNLKNYDVYLPDSMLKNDKKSSRLANTRYAAFRNNSSVLLMYSPSLAYLRSYFRYQVFRPVLLEPAPLYLEYFPEANLSYYSGSLHLSEPSYSGSIEEYIERNLPPAKEINTTRVLQLQGRLALEPAEIRGPVFNISSGNKITIKPSVFPGYEDYSLELNFTGDGVVGKSGAKYTAKANKDKRIWFLDQYYQSLDPDKVDLLSKIYLSKKNFTLMHDKPYMLRNGYSLELVDVSEKGESVFIRLLKNDEILDEAILHKKEKYTYNRSIRNRNLTVVSFRVEDAFYGSNSSMATIKNLYQYSDEPLELKVGDKFGKFQITSITSEKIIMENTEPLTFPKGEKTLILDDTIGFNVSSNVWKAYVFRNEKLPGKHRARGIFYKGGWYPATKGSVLSFNASNFSGFHYDFENDISYESFTASFSADGVIGSATYTAYIHNGTTWFMGEEYNVFGRVLTKKIFDDKVSIHTDKPLRLSDGYVLSLKDVSERSSSAMLDLKRNGKTVKSDVVEKGDVFSYDKKIGGRNIPVITAKIDGILRGRKESLVTMNLKQYSNHFEIKPGDKYGSFKVSQINSTQITLELNKKISISKKSVVNVLGDYLKFQVKNDEWKVYPFVEIEAKKAGVI